VVRRGLPVGAAGDAGVDQRALAGRPAAVGEDRAAVRVEALGPGLLDERLAEQELAGGAIEQVVEPVAVGPADRAALAGGQREVGEDRGLVGVPVVLVVWAELEVPGELAGLARQG